MRTYEVFVKQVGREEDGFRHLGSLEAPSADLALDQAHEIYARRIEVSNLWVVDRNDVHEGSLADRAGYRIPVERPYRQAGFYIARAKARGITDEEG